MTHTKVTAERKSLHDRILLFISLCSFFVAGLSLYFAITAQAVDRAYKEVAIAPRLSFRSEPYAPTFRLENQGLGPAWIRDVAFTVAGECVHLSQSTRQGAHDMEDRFQDEVAAALDPLFDQFEKEIGVPQPYRNWDMHLYDTVIPGGKEQRIFSIDELYSGAFTKALRQNVDATAEFAKKFKDWTNNKMKISILYCSATGVTCERLGTSMDECKVEF